VGWSTWNYPPNQAELAAAAALNAAVG